MDSTSEFHPEQENNKITKLIIEKDKNAVARNIESKVKFNVRKFTVSRNDSYPAGYEFYKLSNLSNTKNISIVLKDGDKTKNVELPEEMLGRIAEFISKMNRENKGFDCGKFVQAAYGVPNLSVSSGVSAVDHSKWTKKPFDGQINPGEAILITNKKIRGATNRHYAIYLGDGIYLSKFGTIGSLIACNIEEMKQGFNGRDVIKLELKK